MNDRDGAVVWLRQALPRRARRSNLTPIDLSLPAGVHAVVGTPADGTLLIAELLGGFEPNTLGEVRVAGRDPARDPLLRKRMGTTLAVPRLPGAKAVGDVLRRVDTLRGGPPAIEMLGALGLLHWENRKLAALSPWEARTLDLALAISTVEPIALVLTEPGADIAPFDRQFLRARLASAGSAGACVVVVTASMSDAIELAATIHIFERGRVTRWVPADETGALVPGRGIELRVEVDLPRLLVAALADEPSVIGIDWDEQRHRSVLSIRGADLDRLALAVARASAAAGASVRSITPMAPQLDDVRAAASGLALAAYHAAYKSYSAPRGAEPAPAAPPIGGS